MVTGPFVVFYQHYSFVCGDDGADDILSVFVKLAMAGKNTKYKFPTQLRNTLRSIDRGFDNLELNGSALLLLLFSSPGASSTCFSIDDIDDAG